MNIFSILLHPFPLTGLLLIAFLPWRWLWRLIAAFCLLLLTVLRLFPAGDGPGYALGLAIAFVILTAWGLAVAARIAFQLLRRARPDAGKERGRVLTWVDRILAAAAGGVAALYFFTAIGWMTQCTAHGYFLHAGVILCGLAVAGANIPQTGRLISIFMLTGGLVLAALSAWGVFVFPRTVVAAALEAAAGRPFCIGLLERQRTPQSPEDLTFLTMDKSAGGHAALLVLDKAGPKSAHWSYYARAFSNSGGFSRTVF